MQYPKMTNKSNRACDCPTAAHLAQRDSAFDTTGNGGYGRLGHVKQQDEFKPRNVETFNQRVPVAPDMVSSLYA